jgi:hypothetical protein
MKKIEWYHSLIVFLLFLILSSILGTIAMLTYSEVILEQPFTLDIQFSLVGLLISSSFMFIFMVLTPWVYLQLLKVNPKRFYQFQKPILADVLFAIVGVIAIGTVISAFVAWLVSIYPSFNDGIIPLGFDFHEKMASVFRQAGYLEALTLIFIMAVLPGFGEEFIFRGFMQRVLNQRFNLFVAILLSGGIFASIHLTQQISQAIAAFFISFYLGYLYYKTKNLLLPMIGHMVNNALFGIIMFFNPDMPANEQPSMLYIFLSVIVGAYSLWYFKNRFDAKGA